MNATDAVASLCAFETPARDTADAVLRTYAEPELDDLTTLDDCTYRTVNGPIWVLPVSASVALRRERSAITTRLN